jgi:hypothetical protein
MKTTTSASRLDIDTLEAAGASADGRRASRPPYSLDPEIVALHGDVLKGLPPGALPLPPMDIELDADNEPVPLARRVDSVAPAALPVVPEAPGVLGPGPVRRFFQAVAVLAVGVALAVAVVAHRTRRSEDVSHALAPGEPAVAVIAPAAPPPNPAVVAPSLAASDAIPAAGPAGAPARMALARRPLRATAHALAAPSTAELEAAPPIDLLAIPPPPTVALDRSAAAIAIAAAGRGAAAACADAEDGPVVVPVCVTFEPAGRVTSARVTKGPLTGTAEGACVAKELRGASVPPFDGDPVTVNTTIRLR